MQLSFTKSGQSTLDGPDRRGTRAVQAVSSELEFSLHCLSELHLHPLDFASGRTCQEPPLGGVHRAFLILVLNKSVRLHGDAAIWTGNSFWQIGRGFHASREYTFLEACIAP